MLLEIAVGDAYGAGFEYAAPDYRRKNELRGYVKHPRHRIACGSYTDDTQMSLAIAELLVDDEPWNYFTVAHKFVSVFKRDQREGYAGGFYKLLCDCKDGDELREVIKPDSDKSGAAMRAPPLGVLKNAGSVMGRAQLQAEITHNTPDGIHAAQAAALMTHYFLYDIGPKEELGKYLTEMVPGQWDCDWVGKVRSKGWMSVRAAVTLVKREASQADILRNAVDFGGDVDTVASIALAAASCCPEITPDLPPVLMHGLENRQFGRDYIARLDQKLLALVGQ